MNIGSYNNPYTVATAQPSARAAFIRNTYLHLAMAVMALIAIEAVFLQTAMAKSLALKMAGGGSMGWLVVLGLFMVASWVANKWAHSDTSRGLQYAGLALFTVAEAAILALPLTIATSMPRFDGVISQALMVTLGLFLGLSAVAFMTKKDFSFLGSVIAIGSFVALGFIIAGALFGFSLGLIFTVAMILLMAASILYTTSNVMHHYRTDQHVAASLALLSSVATLFWYVLQFFMASRD
ncbi:MAG: FtsH-binding integral membrane protein [Verrucomicrobiales bacterium]|jgi:FtsH-binding integral membrane protein